MRAPWIRAAAGVLLAACQQQAPDPLPPQAVLQGYRQLAEIVMDDAVVRAHRLHAQIEALLEQPSPGALEQARAAWIAAREPYSFAEALRFGHGFMDEADERINPWPIDEGFLDYVAEPYSASPTNVHGRLNLVAASDRLRLDERMVDTNPIQRITLKSLQELSDIESNLATGYHVIEFLLWGQDRSATGPGERPWTDYALDESRCTDGLESAPLRHCRRRGQLLRAATEILVQDLEMLRAQWSAAPGSFGDRFAHGDRVSGLRRMLFGLATMSAEELAGERMSVALLTGGQEEELDCFSDTTHRSLAWNARGIAGFYRGRYGDHRVPSLADWMARHHPALAAELEAALIASVSALVAIEALGASGETFDRLIQPEHPLNGAPLRQAVAALEHQATLFERMGRTLQLGLLNPRGKE